MPTKINLEIKDYTDSFNEPHKKKPYFLYIQYGQKNFVFSNKNKANRFLSKFKKESHLLFKELGLFISDLHLLNIKLVSNMNYLQFKKNTDNLSFSSERYAKFLSNFQKTHVPIGREIDLIYYDILNQYAFFNKFLSKNNRSNILLENVKIKTKMMIRLKKDFDCLLIDADGINQVTKSELTLIKYDNILFVA